jgi:uncharacterized protein (DUF2147 family)
MSDELIEVFLVTRPDCGKNFCVYRTWEAVKDGEFDGAEDGDTIYVTQKTMTQNELDNLPDFEGW